MPTHKIDTAGHWLRADAAASYLRMIAAGMPAGGIDVFGRTLAEQWAVYRAWLQGGALAAYPRASAPHVKGVAFDAHTTTSGRYAPSPAHAWLTAGGAGGDKPSVGERLRANSYGWSRTVPSERWHFGYNPAADRLRASDLAARLKTLGYPTVKAFQKAHKLTVDGIDGPATWAALLGSPIPAPVAPPVIVTPPPVVVVPPPVPTLARVATLNCHGWNVPKSAWTARERASLLAEIARLNCSIYSLTECPEYMRDAIRDHMPGGSERWRVATRGDGYHQAVLFDNTKWKFGGSTPYVFGPTPYHGGVWATFTQTTTKAALAVGAYHLPPNVVSSDTTQTRYLRSFLADAPKVAAKLAGGDGADESSWAVGWKDARLVAAASVNSAAGTYGKAIRDRIFLLGAVVRHYTVGPVIVGSDHRSVLAQITIPATITTN